MEKCRKECMCEDCLTRYRNTITNALYISLLFIIFGIILSVIAVVNRDIVSMLIAFVIFILWVHSLSKIIVSIIAYPEMLRNKKYKVV